MGGYNNGYRMVLVITNFQEVPRFAARMRADGVVGVFSVISALLF